MGTWRAYKRSLNPLSKDECGQLEPQRKSLCARTVSPMDSENQSSQAKAVPQAKAASKSSDPARVVAPVTSNAKATYLCVRPESQP